MSVEMACLVCGADLVQVQVTATQASASCTKCPWFIVWDGRIDRG